MDDKTAWLDRRVQKEAFIALRMDFILIAIIYALLVKFSIFDFLGQWQFLKQLEGSDSLYLAIEKYPLILREFILVWVVAWLANFLMALSPLRATAGMFLYGLKFSDVAEISKPVRAKSALVALFSLPIMVVANLFFLLHIGNNFDVSFHQGASAFIISIGIGTALYLFYMFKFGNVIAARQSLSGMATVYRPWKRERLGRGFDKRSILFRTWEERFAKLSKFFEIAVLIPASIIFLYLSFLAIVDFFEKPRLEKSLYAPYAINWGEDNGAFALFGLIAPAEEKDSFEFGRSMTYRIFVDFERTKKKAGIPYHFEIPPSDMFRDIDPKAAQLDFIELGEVGNRKHVECIYALDGKEKYKNCASFEDIDLSIEKNSVLWKRFNKLPDYQDFQIPPQGIDSNFNGMTYLELSRLKAAQIIKMQRDGHSKEAYSEWERFMRYYQRAAQAKSPQLEKAIFFVSYGLQLKVLETLLFQDPQLATDHFNSISNALLPRGSDYFRVEKLFLEDASNFEPYILAMGIRPASGIRNRVYDCYDKYQRIYTLPADQFFSLFIKDNKICPEFEGEPYQIFADLLLTTPGNIFSSTVFWSVNTYGEQSKDLASVFFKKDAEMRMILLGAKILHDKIPAHQVGQYIQTAPDHLKNPINKMPYLWNAQGRYLYFTVPAGISNKEPEIVKFRFSSL